jgi:hypothetical protein
MKTTKEWFSRFHHSRFDQLRLRRQSTPLLLVNLFFKTIRSNLRIKSRRPIRLLAALLAWLSLGPLAAHATDFIWHSPSGGLWGDNGNWSGGPHPTSSADTATFNAVAGSSPLVTLGPTTGTPSLLPIIGTLNLDGQVGGGFTFQGGHCSLVAQRPSGPSTFRATTLLKTLPQTPRFNS